MDPLSGSVASGASQEITLTFDATGLDPGTSTAFIIIANNDPDEDPFTVPVTLTVPPPDIAVTPLSFDVTLDRAQTSTRAMIIDNTGEGTLAFEIDSDALLPGGFLGIAPLSGLVAPGSSQEITLTFQAGLEVGTDTAIILIHSNDPDEDPVTVPVSLAVQQGPPPEIEVSPLSFSERLSINEVMARTLTIDNIGAGFLDVTLAVEEPGTGTAPWLSVEPTSAVVSPGGFQDITVTFDTTGMLASTSTANIIIANNDPDEDPTIVMATLTVPPPDIDVTPAIFQVVLDRNQATTSTLTILNIGEGTLVFEIDVATTSTPAAAVFNTLVTFVQPALAAGVSSDTPTVDVAAGPSFGMSQQVPATVAIFEDVLPWGNAANEQTLSANGIPFDVFNSSSMGSVDLSPYDKVIIASVQPGSFYDALIANASWFENYVISGGFLEMHLASQTSAGLHLRTGLPGGFVVNYSGNGYQDVTIADATHSIVTTPNLIADADLDNWNASTHGFFETVPSGAQLIIEETFDQLRVALEHRLGTGTILVTTQTVEWGGASPEYLENMLLFDETRVPWLSMDPLSGSVASGASQEITLTFDATGLDPGTSTAFIIIANNDPNENPFTAPVTLTVQDIPVADLSIDKGDSADPAAIDGRLTYNLTVTNNGPSDATEVVLTDDLPLGVTFVSSVPEAPDCTESSGTVICNLGTLNTGASANVDIIVTTTASGTITNTASVTSNEPDPNTGNNAASEETMVGVAPPPPPPPPPAPPPPPWR